MAAANTTSEDQMPVEESGNILLLFAAVGTNGRQRQLRRPLLAATRKMGRLPKRKGLRPRKPAYAPTTSPAISPITSTSPPRPFVPWALSATSANCTGTSAEAAQYSQLAQQFAQKWITEADDGDHYRLAFDRPGTWSQKYNLIWDRILGLKLFPPDVARKEMNYYKKMENQFGLPLDNRKTYTKLDWETWTATLTQDRADFETIIAPIFRFLNETPDRSPMTDWYETKDARKVGFDARPVVGGVFAEMLYNHPVWSKWAGRDRTKAANWAPIPKSN